MTLQRSYKGEGLEAAEPSSPTVPHGSGGAYSRKYVRVPVDVLRHRIIPAASDAAAQTLVARSIPRAQRLAAYRSYLSRFISLGIEIYRSTNDLNKVTAQGILEGSTATGQLTAGRPPTK